MGNQCCQGHSAEDKNTISMANKDQAGNIGSNKNNDNDKFGQEESTRQLKEKYGKSIVSHNSKQDYQEGDDRLGGSQTNNGNFDEQTSNNERNIDKQASHQYGSSQRDLQGAEATKQVTKAGSNTNLKGQSAQTTSTNHSKSTATGDTHITEHTGANNQKDTSKDNGQSMTGSTQPIAKQSSSSKQVGQEGKNSKSSSVDKAQPQSSSQSKSQGLPPTSSTSQSKPKKTESSPADLKKSTDEDKGRKSSPSITKSPSRPSKSGASGGDKAAEFNISADNFIHLKKGSITTHYKVGEVLGEGAFGQVSKVIYKSTGMVRAMKTIKKNSIIKEEEDKLFSEMNILKNLDHPNILRLIELFQDNKNYYLVTEYCSGGELFDKIKSMTHFTEKMAADYMKQILSAVVYCHQNSIVHRDLKPENLLFDSDKKNANIKVIDFGTSRKYDKAKKMSKRLGTPYYIAPEVLDQNYDEKCDVWSCGVILYILLCGYPPFGGRSEDEILKKVRLGKFKFEPEDWDRISEEAKNLIKKMLTYDPKKRISAEGALNDPWIQKNAPANHISTRALSNLSSFYTRSKLKQAILTFIVSQVVSQQDKEELQKTFRSLDKNGDGTLSKDELIDGYTTVLGDKEKAAIQVEKILDEVDINKSGKVDFTEFLMAASNKEILLSKAKVEQSFKIFDQDGNGNITKEELSYIMGDIPDDFWKQILEECDTNKDGMISQNEFIDLLLMKKNPVFEKQ